MMFHSIKKLEHALVFQKLLTYFHENAVNSFQTFSNFSKH